MVRSIVVSWALVASTAAAGAGAGQAPQNPPGPASRPEAPAVRPFESLMSRLSATEPGTYLAKGPVFTKAPEEARIDAMLQADVLRGPENTTRVGIVVGAQAPRLVEVRLRVWTVAAGREAARVVADAGGTGGTGPVRLVREFPLAPGDYDLEAVVGHPEPGGGRIVAVAKSRLTVPDIRGGSLVITPIVAGEAKNGERQQSVPFIFGQTTITPSVSPRFSQGGTISVAFRIYNWTAKAEEKPDLTVEYLFYERGAKGLHFFNKVKPQQLNGDTLGAAFDPSAGSVAAGMLISLGAFTFGDFQLTVKVTDNRAKTTAERHLDFAVAP